MSLCIQESYAKEIISHILQGVLTEEIAKNMVEKANNRLEKRKERKNSSNTVEQQRLELQNEANSDEKKRLPYSFSMTDEEIIAGKMKRMEILDQMKKNGWLKKDQNIFDDLDKLIMSEL